MRRFCLLASVAGLVALAAHALLVILPPPSNCGGNSAAGSNVAQFAGNVLALAEQRPDRTFSLASATAEERQGISSVTPGNFVGSVRYLVSMQPVRALPGEPRRPLIVCDRAFNNYPRTYLFANPFTHAVGYSDGTAELISEERYAALNLSSFTPVDRWLAELGPLDPPDD